MINYCLALSNLSHFSTVHQSCIFSPPKIVTRPHHSLDDVIFMQIASVTINTGIFYCWMSNFQIPIDGLNRSDPVNKTYSLIHLRGAKCRCLCHNANLRLGMNFSPNPINGWSFMMGIIYVRAHFLGYFQTRSLLCLFKIRNVVVVVVVVSVSHLFGANIVRICVIYIRNSNSLVRLAYLSRISRLFTNFRCSLRWTGWNFILEIQADLIVEKCIKKVFFSS